MKTTIIVPTYNERANLPNLVEGVAKLNLDLNLIIVDDNSPDGTADLVKDLAARWPWLKIVSRPTKEGQGSAYKFILSQPNQWAESEVLITMDADGSHDPLILSQLLAGLKDYDLVIGSRYVAGGQTVGWSKQRQILSRVANFLTRHLLGLKIKDATAGFVAMHYDLVRQIPWSKLDAAGYAFHVELKHYAVKKLRAKVLEVPITFTDRRAGESKISLSIMLEWLVIIAQLALKRVTGY